MDSYASHIRNHGYCHPQKLNKKESLRKVQVNSKQLIASNKQRILSYFDYFWHTFLISYFETDIISISKFMVCIKIVLL